MDPLADLLEGARARGGVFEQTVLDPPWCLRIADEAPLALATAIRGQAWLVPDDDEALAIIRPLGDEIRRLERDGTLPSTLVARSERRKK